RDEIYALQKELDGKRLDHRAKIREILTEEQRAAFDKRGGMGMGRGMGMGHNRQGRMRMNTGRMGRGMGRGMGAGAGMGAGMGQGFSCPFRGR
ncbi:MAG: hypothetical protein ACYDH0_09655, partial [Candidatus Aminicenantales bacterium]